MNLNDRMKMYESYGTQKLLPRLPICVRLDGKSFHTWTRGLDKPFDKELMKCMEGTAFHLAQYTNARVTYTQSDEITLILWEEDYASEPIFGGKTHKLISLLAAYGTSVFNELAWSRLAREDALFDARAWVVPNLDEAANVILWRNEDCIRNSMQSCAQAHFSPKQLHWKKLEELREMMRLNGDPWEERSLRERFGHYLVRSTESMGDHKTQEAIEPVRLRDIEDRVAFLFRE